MQCHLKHSQRGNSEKERNKATTTATKKKENKEKLKGCGGGQSRVVKLAKGDNWLAVVAQGGGCVW